jgi:DMSO/TMAO reductase YedYZ molybdopterin-dependent catalytic subunit
MRLQFTNSAILVCLFSLSLTGIVTLITSGVAWIMDIHRFSAWALLALAPTKAGIILRSLRQGLSLSWDRGLLPILSSLMLAIVLLGIGLGLTWVLNLNDWWVVLGQTVISWHWILGLALLPLLLLHTISRWPNPQTHVLFSRRAAVKSLAIGALGLFGWQFTEALADTREDKDHPRRLPTGSRRYGSFQGNAFPVTTNYGEDPRQVLVEDWKLTVGGLVTRPLEFTYTDLLAMRAEVWTATLDCTVGWYTTQDWQGIPLKRLLDRCGPTTEARFLRLNADTGYSKPFRVREGAGILLATHVGGERLAHQHGYPLRAVIPARRGWFWVKWLSGIELFDNDGR